MKKMFLVVAVVMMVSSTADALDTWATWNYGGPVELIYVTPGYIRVTIGSLIVTPTADQCTYSDTLEFNIENTDPHYKVLLSELMMAKALQLTLGYSADKGDCGGTGAQKVGTWIVVQ